MRIFDIRTIIGGLFGLYGSILTVAGLFTSSSDLRKAQDIRINLYRSGDAGRVRDLPDLGVPPAAQITFTGCLTTAPNR